MFDNGCSIMRIKPGNEEIELPRTLGRGENRGIMTGL